MTNRATPGIVVIAGGSGFLGVSLAHHLAHLGYHCRLLCRHPPRNSGPWEVVQWDGHSCGDWVPSLNGALGLVNLVGRTVDCIKTPDHQDEILRSRVESTRTLGIALRQLDNPPAIWIQMSTAHIYGDPPTEWCHEDSAFGYGLAPFVARAWEEQYHASLLPDQKPILLRTSFVIGRNRGAGGGALATLRWLARMGLAGRIGTGTQGMSWIHEADLNRLFERALVDPSMQGVYIASSPNPVSQVAFMKTLRHVVGMPIGLPATEWMVRLGAHYLMRTDPELILYGRYVFSERLKKDNFVFHFPNLEPALRDLLGC